MKSALYTDISIVRPPLSEASFRVSLQVYVWMDDHITKKTTQITSGLTEDNSFTNQVYFEGPMSSDFLQDDVRTRTGKTICHAQAFVVVKTVIIVGTS